MVTSSSSMHKYKSLPWTQWEEGREKIRQGKKREKNSKGVKKETIQKEEYEGEAFYQSLFLHQQLHEVLFIYYLT